MSVLRSLAIDPRLPSRKFGGEKSAKQIGFAANVLLTMVGINMKNVREWAILDLEATSHFLVSTVPMSNVQPVMTPLTTKLPDEAHIKSTTTCMLALPGLTMKAKEVHIILGLSHHSLLSVVTSCNAGCEVNFNKIGWTIKYRGK